MDQGTQLLWDLFSFIVLIVVLLAINKIAKAAKASEEHLRFIANEVSMIRAESAPPPEPGQPKKKEARVERVVWASMSSRHRAKGGRTTFAEGAS